MVEYGCNVTNKFGFMSDDDEFDDPQEFISRVTQLEAEKAAAQKKADKLAKQAASVVPKDPVKSTGKENSRPAAAERGRGGRGGRGRGAGGGPRPPRQEGDFSDRFGEQRGERGERGGRGGPRGRGRGGSFRGRGGNPNSSFTDVAKDTQDHVDEVQTEAPPAEFFGERRGRGGRGSFNGERRGRGGFRGGRQFDRQSGSDRTGVRGVDKKDGHGRGNWGDDKDELAGETEPVALAEEPEAPREKTAEELAQEALEAEYAKQKTLKEYIEAQKKEAPKFNVRKAGEGEEENFGKLVKLQKEVVVDKEEEEVSIIRREPREKALHIDIQFAEPNRSFRGDRGDRTPRGRGGRGSGPRGGRGGIRPPPPPHFDSSLDAFPALGSK